MHLIFFLFANFLLRVQTIGDTSRLRFFGSAAWTWPPSSRVAWVVTPWLAETAVCTGSDRTSAKHVLPGDVPKTKSGKETKTRKVLVSRTKTVDENSSMCIHECSFCPGTQCKLTEIFARTYGEVLGKTKRLDRLSFGIKLASIASLGY